MAIHWDEIRLLRVLDRFESEERADQIDGLQLMLVVAGDQQTTALDRVSLTRLLYVLSQQGRLSFELKHDPDVAVPSVEDPGHLQWLWRFRRTDTGRDRPRARVLAQHPPDSDIDDGRPIPGLALDRFAGVIAAWYNAAQLSKFLRDSGLPRIRSAQPHGGTEDLSANLAAYAQGNNEQRRQLRRFLAALLNGELDPVLDSNQRDELIATLAMAGWHLREDILVIGERLIPTTPRATTASTPATALEREAVARAGEVERERDLAFEQAHVSELARQAAEQQIKRVRQDVERAEQQAAGATRRAEQAETRLDDAVKRAEQHARSERAELERELAEQREAREEAVARAGEVERERDLAFEQAHVSELARQAAEQQIERVRQDVERAEQQAAGATRRAEQAETRLDDAVKRAEQHARSERAELERELAEQREARETVELERDRAQAALDAEQRLRAQLQTDLQTAQQRLEVAEKARDATIATDEQPAIRSRTPRRKT